jgi:hypothetical protein
VGVAQIVNTNTLHADRSHGFAEALRDLVRVPRLAVLSGEHVARTLPCHAPLEAFGVLLSLPRTERGNCPGPDVDAATVAALERSLHDLVPDLVP